MRPAQQRIGGMSSGRDKPPRDAMPRRARLRSPGESLADVGGVLQDRAVAGGHCRGEEAEKTAQKG